MIQLTNPDGSPREHLSSRLPGLQTTWDSTSLEQLKTCPRKYYLSQLCGWRHEGSVHLTFGIHFHKAGEYYDAARMAGADNIEATRTAVRQLLIDTEGWESTDPKKNRESVIRAAVWYFDHYEHDMLTVVKLPNGKPATELSFRLETDFQSAEGEPYALSGHLDRVVEGPDGLYIQDKKTTGMSLSPYYFEGYNPHNQMSLYAFAGQIVLKEPIKGVIIDAAQIGANFVRLTRGYTLRTVSQLAEWYLALPTWFKQAELYASTGNWPMNESSCGNYGGCIFRSICSKDPKIREDYLKANFVVSLWNPCESRNSGED